MSDIFLPLNPTEVKQKVRTNKITISNPYEGNKVISMRNEMITLVDGIERGRENISNTSRQFNDVLAETITITDPVTQQEITISVAGVALVIEETYVNWWNEDNNLED